MLLGSGGGEFALFETFARFLVADYPPCSQHCALWYAEQLTTPQCQKKLILPPLCPASSKVLIYLFLSESPLRDRNHARHSVLTFHVAVERVHLVYSSQDGGEQSRLKSKFYRLSVLFLFLWLGVAIAMVVGRISYRRRHDQACVIGIKLFSSVPMLVVDAIGESHMLRKMPATVADSVPSRNQSTSTSRPLSSSPSGGASLAVHKDLLSSRLSPPWHPS